VSHSCSTSGCSQLGWNRCTMKNRTTIKPRAVLCNFGWSQCMPYLLVTLTVVVIVSHSWARIPCFQDTSRLQLNLKCSFPPCKIVRFPIDYRCENKSFLPLSFVLSTHLFHECNSVPLYWNDGCDYLCSYLSGRHLFSYFPPQKSWPRSFLTPDGFTTIWYTNFWT
jgi:hypothetical protein